MRRIAEFAGKGRYDQQGRFDDAAHFLDQCRVPPRQIPSAATLTSQPAFHRRRGVELILSPTNGRARQLRHLRDYLQGIPAGCADLAGREQPPSALIELRAYQLPPAPIFLPFDHADPLTATAPL